MFDLLIIQSEHSNVIFTVIIYNSRIMKKLSFLILLIAVSPTLFGQEYLIEPTIVNVDSSKTKDDIYSSVQVYLAEVYGDQREVIRLADPDQGLIIGKGAAENYMTGIFGEKTAAGWWKYTFKIEMKEGRYRYSIYDVYLENQGQRVPESNYHGYIVKRLEELPDRLKPVFEEIPISSSSSEDW